MSDKFKAVWVSFSSISDFIRCPRAYYLKNIYKNPQTGKKIEITSPPLSLGTAIHDVLEPLAGLSPDKRFDNDLIEIFDLEFSKYQGDRGGFAGDDEFSYYQKKGHKMLANVMANKYILEHPTYITDKPLLDPWLSEKNNIVICGKIDWINKDEETSNLSVIDFKTSKEEDINDLQLQIYALLLFMLNRAYVNNLSYWFLDINESLTETNLPDVKEAYERILALALEIKEARNIGVFECVKGECFHCRDYEKILRGEATRVGTGNYGREIYIT